MLGSQICQSGSFSEGHDLGIRCVDGPIRANRFADSRESPDSRESLQGSRTEPLFFANRASGGWKIANRRFEAIRANRSNVMKHGSTLLFQPQTVTPIINSTLRSNTLQGVDFGSILGQFLVSFGQK